MTRAEYDMGQPDGKKPEGCAIQMDTFADMIRSTARELENSIFTDERLEKKIGAALKKKGVRMLYAHFFMTKEGRYEIHVTARSVKHKKISARNLSSGVGGGGRRLILQSGRPR